MRRMQCQDGPRPRTPDPERERVLQQEAERQAELIRAHQESLRDEEQHDATWEDTQPTSSSAHPEDAPLDPDEEPILEQLLKLRTKLLDLKSDRSTHIKCCNVMPLYNQLVDEVAKLNQIRVTKVHEQNRLDRVLDDCFQLISLFFMTLGKNDEAPAVYAATSNVTRLCSHLEESKLYSAKDLGMASNLLHRMREVVEKGKESYSPVIITLLDSRVSICEMAVQRLHAYISTLDARLHPVHEKLISILRSMTAAATRQHFPAGEVKHHMKQLQEISDSRVDGKFLASDGSAPEDQEVVQSLLGRVLRWADAVLKREAKVDDGVKTIYDELYEIRMHLEKIALTQAWSMRETDLYEFQRRLVRIDDSRVDGSFVDAQGEPTDIFSQRLCLYLLRRNYAYIFMVLAASEPVSEALLPIYNQLSTLRRCLIEVRSAGGVGSIRELYPYQMKLDSIDRMRVDGNFKVGNDVPDGQGAVNVAFRECHYMIMELRASFEGHKTTAAAAATAAAAVPVEGMQTEAIKT